MDRVALLGVVLALGACSSFVSADSSGAETEAGSGEESGQSTAASEDSTATNPTSGTGGDTNSGTATDPTIDPSTTGNPTTDPTGSGTTSGGNEATGNASTGSDSTGPEATDDSSTGDPVQTCGDKRVGGNEDCDDGNADELDGCTTNCVVGPTGLDFGSTLGTGLAGGSGTAGISDNTEECPAGHVLVGLQGDLTAEPWLGVIGGICRPAALTNTDPPEFATGAPPTALLEHGQFDGGGSWVTECDSDEAIVAVQGGSGSVMDGLQVRCASIDTMGPAGAYTLHPIPELRLEPLQGGAGGGPFGPLTCPPGRVASGLRTLTNSYVIQIELLCRELNLTY